MNEKAEKLATPQHALHSLLLECSASSQLQLDAARPQVRRILVSPALHKEAAQAGDVVCSRWQMGDTVKRW